jgi:hypothetical protein
MARPPRVTDPTPEMLAAGEAAVLDRLGTIRPIGFSAMDLAVEVWEAMAAHAPRAAGGTMRFKLDTTDLERCVAQFAETVAEFKAAVDNATAEDDGP